MLYDYGDCGWKVDDILWAVTKGDLYGQLAEECCELAKAALKAQRYFQGTNPPAQNGSEIMDSLDEEVADVLLMIDVAMLAPESNERMTAKLRRWHDRLGESVYSARKGRVE